MTRALPSFRHRVLFLSPPDRETIEAFAPVPVSWKSTVTPRDIERVEADVVLLHNVSAARVVGKLPAPAVLYLHSAIDRPVRAEVAVCCSYWLASRLGMPPWRVLWQACELNGAGRWAAKRQRRGLVVGRICTPVAKKWPTSVVSFYAELADRCPDIAWEFVGCPASLQPKLRVACRDRIRFYPAGWQQRELLIGWDAMLYSHPAVVESFGRTAAEAMLAGCIPVVDRRGGFIEQIPPDCGFLCDTIDEFAAALRKLRDDDVRQTASARGQQHAQAWFSLPRFARDLVSWLSESRELRDKGREPAATPA